MQHVLFKRVSIFSCVFTRVLSFMICLSRTGHPTEVFRSTRVCSSRTCAQANSACLGNKVPANISSSVFVVARVLPCTPGRALTYFHIPVIAACFVQTGPSLEKPRVSIFPALSCASIHQWCDGPRRLLDSSISLKSCFELGCAGRFCLSGNGVPARFPLSVSLVARLHTG